MSMVKTNVLNLFSSFIILLGLLERYKIPPIPNIYYFLPQVLTDLTKKKWTLGRSIGTGGFGEIYLAVEGEGARVGDDARYRQRFI